MPNGNRQRARGVRHLWLRARPFAFASLVVAAAAATAPVLQRLPHANLSLLFMTGVLIVAVRHGIWPSIYASVLSFLAFNFFFTSPRYTFKVGAQGDVATLLFFLVVASLTANLAARLRDAMARQEKAMARTEALQALTRRVAGAVGLDEVLRILVQHLGETYSCNAVAVVSDPRSGRVVRADSRERGGSESPTEGELLSGGGQDVAGWTVLPLRTGLGRIGAAAVHRPIVAREEHDYATALTEQAAVAAERALLASDLEQARLEAQRQELRVALLSSVSHDLRTPLSSVIGAASSLLACGSLEPEKRDVLLQSIVDEAERLDRYIQNLLDMTRVGQDLPQSPRDWDDLRDLVSAAAKRLRLASRGVHLELDVAPDAELVHAQGDLLEQVFVNLLDNAGRYSPEGGTVRVQARRGGNGLVIEVSDEGPGIPEDEREKIFDPFYRVHERDRKSGTGLGLSICRGIVAAHGGEIAAIAPGAGRGALIRLSIPQPPVPAQLDGDD
jgi:two-component system sensor histidine kinase KdpD